MIIIETGFVQKIKLLQFPLLNVHIVHISQQFVESQSTVKIERIYKQKVAQLICKNDTHQIILLAVNLSMDIIESFSPKGPTTGTAYEAASVIEISHCLAGFGRPSNFFPTSVTDTYCIGARLFQNSKNL
jgi:hypothetical protein